jgi:hypothetical protein
MKKKELRDLLVEAVIEAKRRLHARAHRDQER